MVEQEWYDGKRRCHTRNKRLSVADSKGVEHLPSEKRSSRTADASRNNIGSYDGSSVVRVGVSYVTKAGHMDQHQACRQNRATRCRHDPMHGASGKSVPMSLFCENATVY